MTVAGTDPELIGAPPPSLARDRMVRVWLAGVTVSVFGDFLWTVALAWTAAHTLHPALAGLVLGIDLLPQAVLVLLGGVLADRFDTRRIMVSGQVGQAVVLLVGAVVWRSGLQGAPTLMALALAFGVTSGLTLPAGATLARQLVRGEDLGTVSGWNQILGRAARMLGAPAGGVVVATGGPVAAMLLDAVTFAVIAVVLTVGVRPRYRLPKTGHEPRRRSMAGGLHYLRTNDASRLLVLALCALNVFVSPIVALGVSLRASESGWGAAWVGIADATFAVGAVAGSLAGMRWRPAAPARAALLVLVVQGFALAAVGFGLRPTLLAAMLTVGVTAGVASVLLSGVFQRTVAASHLGRVSSVSRLGDMTLMPLSVPAFGAVAGGAGLLTGTLVWGGAMAVLCAWFASRSALAALT